MWNKKDNILYMHANIQDSAKKQLNMANQIGFLASIKFSNMSLCPEFALDGDIGYLTEEFLL